MHISPFVLFAFVLLISLAGGPSGTVQADEEVLAATTLAQQVYDRPLGRDFAQRTVMTLTQKGQQTRKRILYLFHLKESAHERKTLIRFAAPPDVEDTALLTHDHPGDESEQWLYLPALKRVRRISSSRKGGRFVGSDYFYEDLRDREPDMDRHRLIGTDKAGGVECEVLESTPIDPRNSVYGKRVSCIHPKVLIPLRVEFYPRRGKQPIKRAQVRKIKKIQGYWTVLDSTMKDLKTGHTTRLLIKAIKYDQGIPQRLFTREALADPTLSSRHQP